VDLSIIIVNWNGKAVLKNCLQSIFAAPQPIAFEVIVVDNASQDGSSEMVGVEFPNVRILQNSVNLGFSAANNQGFKVAHGRYVLLLNSDTLVLDNALDASVRFMDAFLSFVER
jgi:GT2 family glycosyltransferase